MQKYYRVKTHCRGTPQEYFILRIMNADGDVMSVRTGKKWKYIRGIIRDSNLQPFDSVSRFQR